MNLEEWIREIEVFEVEREFFGPVAGDDIEKASTELVLPFPPQYREFLSNVGCGSVGSESFIGLGGPRYLDVAWVSKSLHAKDRSKKFPVTLIPLRTDGYGNYDAIDTGQPSVAGEYAIVEWRHEGSDADSCRILAASYFEWLESMLDFIREGAE